ncbi:TIGR03086 family metal-binding protein [Actinoplanes sp. NEAU-A12]|uniref:TIGR03086 family metal-binding protein n=1 Tax=Actinoplanes sandaracinus TaxID=3045177 RepID=A0ABT6WSM6_9ACTN|nr:TIGR03086 family metal-binding protein [Actinoplanes sandaracinus]MDI6102746.1 TIGR03086 family metal-binding protein [Actinoplanes sandaracinus]
MPTKFLELVAVDRRAVEHSIELLTPVTSRDLSRRTPCEGWSLADLIAHMTAQHRGFAAAAAGRGADPRPWRVRPLGDDPVAGYREAAAEALAAFPEAEAAAFTMPEIAPQTFPGSMAVGFHLVDYLVHSWDVAAALGVPVRADPEVVAAALPIALAVPDDGQRLSPGAPFRPAVAVTGAVDPLDRVLAALGRDPSWR